MSTQSSDRCRDEDKNSKYDRDGDGDGEFKILLKSNPLSFLVSTWFSCLPLPPTKGGNLCQWVVFVSCQCTDRVNIRQPKPDTNNKRVNIR